MKYSFAKDYAKASREALLPREFSQDQGSPGFAAHKLQELLRKTALDREEILNLLPIDAGMRAWESF